MYSLRKAEVTYHPFHIDYKFCFSYNLKKIMNNFISEMVKVYNGPKCGLCNIHNLFCDLIFLLSTSFMKERKVKTKCSHLHHLVAGLLGQLVYT